MLLIIVSSIIGIFGTIWLWGLISNNEGMKIIGGCFGFFAILFGALACGSWPDHIKTNETNNFKYTKGESHVLIELPDGYYEVFNDADTYLKIEKIKVVYDKREINSFGFEINRKLSLTK
jgi:hypothetical protein